MNIRASKFWNMQIASLLACMLLGPGKLSAQTLQYASASPPLVEIETVDAEIIKQTCELFKVNTALRTEFGRWPRGTKMRMTVVQTINYSCTFAGLLVNMLYNLYFSTHGGTAPKATQLSATVPRFIGKALYVGDLLIEIPLEAIEHKREVAAGFDPETTFRRVREMRASLDALFVKRQQLLDENATSLPNDQLHLLKLEGPVLKDGSDLATNEFCMLYARARSISRRNRAWNGMTFVKKGDATFGADMTRIIAAATDNKYLNGPASISTTFSGAMSCFSVETYMSVQKLAYNSSLREATTTLHVNGVEDTTSFENDRHLFAQAARRYAEGQAPPLAKLASEHSQIYDSMGGMVESLIYQREQELHHQNRHDWHSIAYHTAYGGSKFSRGIWLMYVSFAFLHAKGRVEKQRVSLINGYAGIDNFAGSAYREVDFVTTKMVQFLHRRRDSINRRADSALIASRWDILDAMEHDAAQGVASLSSQQGR